MASQGLARSSGSLVLCGAATGFGCVVFSGVGSPRRYRTASRAHAALAFCFVGPEMIRVSLIQFSPFNKILPIV